MYGGCCSKDLPEDQESLREILAAADFLLLPDLVEDVLVEIANRIRDQALITERNVPSKLTVDQIMELFDLFHEFLPTTGSLECPEWLQKSADLMSRSGYKDRWLMKMYIMDAEVHHLLDNAFSG